MCDRMIMVNALKSVVKVIHKASYAITEEFIKNLFYVHNIYSWE